MRSRPTPIRRILLGMELCGTYARSHGGDLGTSTRYSLEPLTSTRAIADYLTTDSVEAAGYTAIFVTPSRLREFERFEALILRLAHHMGLKRESPVLGPTEQRLQLRRAPFPVSWTAQDCLLV